MLIVKIVIMFSARPLGSRTTAPQFAAGAADAAHETPPRHAGRRGIPNGRPSKWAAWMLGVFAPIGHYVNYFVKCLQVFPDV
jgi:hypothetical protein